MLPAVAALTAPWPVRRHRGRHPPRGRNVPVRFGPSRHRGFRCPCLHGHLPAPGSLRGTTASADSPPGCPVGASPGKGALLPGTTAAFTSATGPGASLCCASSPHRGRPSMRFLFVGPPVSASLPPAARLPSRRWLRVVVLSRFHVRSSYGGLAPRLQRAHAGRTQRNAGYLRPARVFLFTHCFLPGAQAPDFKRSAPHSYGHPLHFSLGLFPLNGHTGHPMAGTEQGGGGYETMRV